jgi:PKD repeat protein
VDHCSFTWARDDTASPTGDTVTIQRCIIANAMYGDTPTDNGEKGMISSGRASVLHCLFANVHDRTPNASGGDNQFVNNLFYNTGISSRVFPTYGPIHMEFVNNYFGTNSGMQAIGEGVGGVCSGCANNSLMYVNGNYPNNDVHKRNGGVPLTNIPLGFPSIPSQIDALEAKDDVLNNVGAMVPIRSPIDQAIIDDVKLGRVTGNPGYSWPDNNTRNLPYPDPSGVTRPASYDTDRDGMPNEWEESHGLDPNDESDGSIITADGYSHLEHYLHSLSGTPFTPVTLVANFTHGPTLGQFPLTVDFDASTSDDTEGSIVDYSWDFGDGSSGNNVTTSHTYTQPGEYTVTLTVTDNEDNTAAKTKTLRLSAPVVPEQVAHWKLDEGSGSVVQDSTGNNVDSQIHGAAWRTEGNRTALYFDGGDYVQVPMTDMSIQSGTVALWAKSESSSNQIRSIFQHTTIPAWSDRIFLWLGDADELTLGLGDNFSLHNNIVKIIPGTWVHVAFTWEEDSSAPGQGDYRVYVDGVEKGSGQYSGLNKLNEFADIGNNGNPDTRNSAFNGLILDVQMYNYALPKEEVEEIAAGAPSPLSPKSPTGLSIRQ